MIEAANRQLEILAADDRKLAARVYVVQLMADVHQPHHAGYADDRDGNT